MVLGIYGSGGAGREIRDIADQTGLWDKIVFIDDMAEPGEFSGLDRMPFDDIKKKYSPEEIKIIIAQGEPANKVAVYEKVSDSDYELTNLIHPTAIVSKSAKLGKGIVLYAGVVILSDCVVEDVVTLQNYSMLGHDVTVRKNCEISHSVMVGGYVEIKEQAYIGMHATIRDRISVGAHSIVGMGAVVTKSVPDNVVVVGNPAVIKGENNTRKVFK